MLCCAKLEWCLTLCDPMNCSPPGSSVYGDSPGQNTGVGCHALLQGIFPIQRSNPGLPRCMQIFYRLSHQGSPSSLRAKNNLSHYHASDRTPHMEAHTCKGVHLGHGAVQGDRSQAHCDVQPLGTQACAPQTDTRLDMCTCTGLCVGVSG